MIRSFIAIELKNEDTINNIVSFGKRLKKNQKKIKLVEPQNLHLTIKFLGNIRESTAPKIYSIIERQINDKQFSGKEKEYSLKGVGKFRGYQIIWVKMHGDIDFLQTVKEEVETRLNSQLKIRKDKRQDFKPHLTIARLKKKRIDYKTFDSFKNIIKENKDKEFGKFTVSKITLKKSELTPKGPIYTDLEF